MEKSYYIPPTPHQQLGLLISRQGFESCIGSKPTWVWIPALSFIAYGILGKELNPVSVSETWNNRTDLQKVFLGLNELICTK